MTPTIADGKDFANYQEVFNKLTEEARLDIYERVARIKMDYGTLVASLILKEAVKILDELPE